MKRETIEQLKNTASITVLTGAGISAESGVPTFRGDNGLWKNFKAEELATPQAFIRDPSIVWEWYDLRRRLLKNIKPNTGHFAISEIERCIKDFLLITQNVDGLHGLAGNKNIIELHGNIWRVRCVSNCGTRVNKEVPLKDIPPYCDCGSLIRPDIVWFGEMLDEADLRKAYNGIRQCDTFLVVGTSGLVQPAASFPIMAKDIGAYVIEVNIEATTITPFSDEFIRGKAGEILPLLADIIAGR